MTSTDLLAKIDALDWDQTVSPATTVMAGDKPVAAKPKKTPTRSRSFGLIAGGMALLGIAAAMYFGMAGPGVSSRGPAGSAPAVSVTPVIGQQAGKTAAAIEEDHDAKVAAAAAAEERRVAMYAKAAEESERKLQDKAERKRKAKEAAAQARLAQQERERRHQEETRLQAEREAAARAAAKAQEAAAVPKGPASPKELCAGESNAFTRGLCESRACSKPEWHNHPFCLKRMEDQLRPFGGN
jgi:hypothetical protein